MFPANLIVLSYHRFVYQESPYRFSRTYDQFAHDIRKKVYDWITIDDGMTCMIKACEILQAHNVRAKLFICTSLVGQRGYCNWDDLRKLSEYHDIENHSHLHQWHTSMDAVDVMESISKAQTMITKEIDRAPRYFVPPYNAFNRRMEVYCKELNLTLVHNRENILNISK